MAASRWNRGELVWSLCIGTGYHSLHHPSGGPCSDWEPSVDTDRKKQSNTQRCHGWVCMSRHHWAPLFWGHLCTKSALRDGNSAAAATHTSTHSSLKSRWVQACVLCSQKTGTFKREWGNPRAMGSGQRRVPSAAAATSLPGAHGGFLPTAQLDLFVIFILQDMFWCHQNLK